MIITYEVFSFILIMFSGYYLNVTLIKDSINVFTITKQNNNHLGEHLFHENFEDFENDDQLEPSCLNRISQTRGENKQVSLAAINQKEDVEISSEVRSKLHQK